MSGIFGSPDGTRMKRAAGIRATDLTERVRQHAFGHADASWRSRRGSASALIILMLVLLIFFGVLALVSAASEMTMARRRADWNMAAYQADAAAEMVLARIDKVCLTAGSDSQAEELAEALGSMLAGIPSVQVRYLRVEAGTIRLDMLILPDPQSVQGIEAVLVVHTAGDDADGRLVIDSWAQWRAPFDYEGQPGGIWEG